MVSQAHDQKKEASSLLFPSLIASSISSKQKLIPPIIDFRDPCLIWPVDILFEGVLVDISIAVGWEKPETCAYGLIEFEVLLR